MDKLKISKCRSCGAPIVWITTTNGKAMPCDARERAYIESGDKKDTVVLETGETVRCTIITGGGMMPQAASGWGRVPHWATCPQAKSWKGGANG